MGSSKLQWIVIYLIFSYLVGKLDRNKHIIAINEAGFQWAPRTWRNLDIAIFQKQKLLKEGINNKYAKTPPEVVIEVNTKADLRKYGDILSYMK